MTRLRMIKDWGPHKAGDIICPQMQRTVDWLINDYKGAVIDGPDMPITVVRPGENSGPPASLNLCPFTMPADIGTSSAPEHSEPKYLRKPKRDKMLKSPRAAKSGRFSQSGGE